MLGHFLPPSRLKFGAFRFFRFYKNILHIAPTPTPKTSKIILSTRLSQKLPITQGAAVSRSVLRYNNKNTTNNQSEGGDPNGVMKLPGRVMAGGVVPAGGFRFLFFVRRRVRAPTGPVTHPRPTRDPSVTHPASSASIQMIITRPSEALRSSSFVCPIQVDRPGTRETVPAAVALL